MYGGDIPHIRIIIVNHTKIVLSHHSVTPWIQTFTYGIRSRKLLPYLLARIKGDCVIFHVSDLNGRHSSISEERLYTQCAERMYNMLGRMTVIAYDRSEHDEIYESHQPPNGVEPIPPPY